jgi:CubicO group peptidase (beta-lactamase class C family)
VKHRAAGYGVKAGTIANANPLSMKPPFSAGALCSTVVDLVAWTEALMGGKIVTHASVEQMTTPGKLSDGKPTTYGFGLGIGERDGRRFISHGGGINGFSSFMGYQPETGTTVVVLTNSGQGKAGDIANELLKAARSGT